MQSEIVAILLILHNHLEEEYEMAFQLPIYVEPNFDKEPFVSAPDAGICKVEAEGVAPPGYHALSIYPEYFKVNSQWSLVRESRMDCVPVVRNEGIIEAVEFRNLHVGDKVIVGRSEDGRYGIYLHATPFAMPEESGDVFSFRTGRSRETAYSRDYDNLYELMRYERDHGYIIWVLGPAVIFDHDSKKALSELIEHGYAHALLSGNAMATHDLEGSMKRTALGQDIYTQEQRPLGHYHHLDLINTVLQYGSIEKFIEEENINDGVMYSAIKKGIPVILAGSIRDDGPLPTVIGNVYDAQDAMRACTKKATTVIALATQLHTIATGNITPCYVNREGRIRPVYFYSIDISEFAVNKLRDRGSLSVTPIVTNVQDFLVHLRNNLVP